MESGTYDRERAFWRAGGTRPAIDPAFVDVWPSETRGDGQVVKNNVRSGSAQGKGSMLKKAHCRLCGFPNDLVRIDHSGGSLDGNGAGGAVAVSTESANTSGTRVVGTLPITHTENVGTQTPRNGSGCALCFSKNSTQVRIAVDSQAPAWERIQPLGF